MRRLHGRVTLALALAFGASLLAACGDDDNDSTPAGPTADAVVSAAQTTAGTVLVDAQGRALYVNDTDPAGGSACAAQCAAIWVPLVPNDPAQATVRPELGGTLGTIQRGDGTPQLTWEGRPLYTFTEDRAAGQVSGDALQDSFDQTGFVWHVARPATASPVPAATTPAPRPYDY